MTYQGVVLYYNRLHLSPVSPTAYISMGTFLFSDMHKVNCRIVISKAFINLLIQIILLAT